MPKKDYPRPLIETDQLARLLGDPHVRILDATYHVPPSPREAQTEYEAAHLPGAVFFDVDAIADTTSTLPHMLPPAAQFEKQVAALGIGSDDYVVVYDAHGIMSAPRAWWMFRAFGHERVAILNGGLPKWQREGRSLESGKPSPAPAVFKAKPVPELVVDLSRMQENLAKAEFQVFDMRSAGRFEGREPEPRAGLRSGHIPGSMNMPWGDLVDKESKTLLPPEQLKVRFEQAGWHSGQPAACTCGSGITACVGALGLYMLGKESVPVYDGSWAEWGACSELPVAQAGASVPS